jgi:hypothetical protein
VKLKCLIIPYSNVNNAENVDQSAEISTTKSNTNTIFEVGPGGNSGKDNKATKLSRAENEKLKTSGKPCIVKE